ncbi:hypothetical protein HK105_206852 [Polyrhizophydium stewartii]|uniref:G-protein coupled receptors family 1 profile domain-containing protein n=1 Tax=Polyrhizophydium stewartii TaxID=2732419 RepID=A0ABR4N2E0_9FUNG
MPGPQAVTDVQMLPPGVPAAITVFFAVAILSVLVNAVLITSLMASRKPLSLDYYLIGSLLMADLGTGLSLCFAMGGSLGASTTALSAADPICRATAFGIEYFAGVGILTLVLIALPPVMVTVNIALAPTRQMIFAAAAFVWILCAGNTMVTALGDPESVVVMPSGMWCHYRATSGRPLSIYIQITNLSVILLSPCIVAASYGFVWHRIWALQTQIKRITGRMNLATDNSESKTCTDSEDPAPQKTNMKHRKCDKELSKARRKAAVRGTVVSGTMLILWTPMLARILYETTTGHRIGWQVDMISLIFCGCNALADPIVLLIIDPKSRCLVAKIWGPESSRRSSARGNQDMGSSSSLSSDAPARSKARTPSGKRVILKMKTITALNNASRRQD